MKRFALLLALTGATIAGAADAPHSYLAGQAIPDLLQVLPPPPAPGSPLDVADRAVFRDTRALAGSDRWKVATGDVTEASLTTFSCAIGMTLDATSAPVLARLLSQIGGGRLVDPVKQHYAKKRPYLTDDGEICEPRTAHLAENGDYPSGHTTHGWSTALVLAELMPERATAILARGRAFGESRYICGSHSIGAVQAGFLSGAALVSTLHASPAFRRDMDAARVELARLRPAAPRANAQRCAFEQRALH